MDYPIPATVTDATLTDALVYDGNATIVINENTSYWGEPKPKKLDASEISGTYRQYNSIVQREAKNIERIDKVRDYLIENYDDLELHADEIAQLLGIDLSKTVEVTFQVEITATISLPIGKDFSDLSEYDFEVSLESTDSDYEIEDYDAQINRMSDY